MHNYWINLTILMIFDITDQKKIIEQEKQQIISNEQSKVMQIIDVVDASIYWKDKDGYMRGCNQYVLNMFGAKERSEVIGKNEYDLVPQDEALKISKIDKYVLEHGSYHGEETFTIAGNKKITMQTSKTQLLDNNGNVIGLVGASLDITAQKEAEKLKLENQTKVYQTRIEEQEKFRAVAAQVAHDIGSPLAALQMVLPHCDTLPENTRNVLKKSAIRITDIAENLLCQFKPKDKVNDDSSTAPVITLIYAELLEILAEKKYQYSKLSINFNCDISQSAAFTFININTRACCLI